MLYLQRYGDDSIPDKHVLLHKCDNPNCINVDHLIVGTHQENMRDMAEKGRAKGRKDKTKILTKKQRANIMKSKKTNAQLAKYYGVTERYIQKIKNGMVRKYEQNISNQIESEAV